MFLHWKQVKVTCFSKWALVDIRLVCLAVLVLKLCFSSETLSEEIKHTYILFFSYLFLLNCLRLLLPSSFQVSCEMYKNFSNQTSRVVLLLHSYSLVTSGVSLSDWMCVYVYLMRTAFPFALLKRNFCEVANVYLMH